MSTDTVGGDLFEGVVTSTPTATTEDETSNEQSDNTSTSSETSEDAPVETVSAIPDGAVSVTDFARVITQHLMTEAFKAGKELDADVYVVPQAVYQTVKAQRDKIPHVLVKADEKDEPRVYILTAEAIPWWMARREKLATRGVSGATSASKRTPEDNLVLLGGAVEKLLYAQSRQTLWNGNVEQSTKLVDKYKGFLAEANVSEDDVANAIQEATDRFNAEQKAKADEKAAKKAKPEPADANA